MVDKNRNESSKKSEELLSTSNILNKFQIFLDNNIRIIRNVSWIIGAIGVIVIVRRTYALHHFTKQSSIPEIYFTNNVTLAGKVVKIHSNGCLGVQHLPLLWRARVNSVLTAGSNLLNVNITGVELQSGGLDFLSSQLTNNNIKFQLLGKNESENIESIIYVNKNWFRTSCINEDIISQGFAKAKHVSSLSHVKAYNQLIEKLVRAEVKAVKRKSGIWKDDSTNNGIFDRTWSWLKNKIFKR